MDRQASTSRNDLLECMVLDETAEAKALPLSLLKHITCGFSDSHEIGRGGFAVVYKGMLSSGLTVAVKKLSGCYLQETEFLREVKCLLELKHKNIVRLLGYCADTQGSVADFNGKAVMAEEQERLLCFEYLPNGSLREHIQDASTGLEWSKRYEIIHGVCEGLSDLHEKNIFHLDLKPENILLDANMVPKISDFGLSRIVEADKSQFVATKMVGTLGYLPPEFTSSNVITHKFDLYSLGVILMEMLTGKKGQQDVEIVLESWSNRLDKSHGDSSFEQIQLCTEIGIECIKEDPKNRPDSIHNIIARLNKTGSIQMKPRSSELLDVQPLVLRFPFESNKPILCQMELTNNTDQQVSFGLMNKNENQQCFARLPLLGVVPPRTAYTLVVTTKKQDNLPEQRYFDLILESTILHVEHKWPSTYYEKDVYFEKAKMLGHVVHNVTLKAVCTPLRAIIRPKVLHMEIPYKNLTSLEMHPTMQWIITGQLFGHVRIWSYETQRLVASFKVSRVSAICSIKFIERKKWFVAGTDDGFIHVYNYEKMQKITSFRANTDNESVISLAVHPTQPYVLSVSANCDQAKLWDWNKGWECTPAFITEYFSGLQFVLDINIASASKDHTIKIWASDSHESKYTLSGHSERVNCMAFFTRNDQQYLITGSDDFTAKIWDLQKKICVHTETFLSKVTSVFASPIFPVLITGLDDGTVSLWSSDSFRVEKVLQQGFIDSAYRLTFLTGPQRVVIVTPSEISVMDIANVSYEAGSTNTCEQQLSADSLEADTTSKVALGSRRLLDVVKLDSCSLQLSNNTYECVAFRIMEKKGGIVPAKSTYTLIVEHNTWDILESSISGDAYIPFVYQHECDEFFEEAKQIGNVVHELRLKANFAPRGATTSVAIISPITKITLNVERHYRKALRVETLCSLDAHPTEPLILTGHKDSKSRCEVRVWSYDTPAKNTMHTEVFAEPVWSKFIAQKQWFVVGTSDGFIHVYNYGTDIQKITSFKATDNNGRLVVHPTQSYAMSLSEGLIKIWEWNKGWSDFVKKNTGWKCTRTFEAEQSHLVWPIAFNPKDNNCFVVASNDHTIKVCNLDSPRSTFTLSGHSDQVNCLEFFTRGDRQYLVTGADDCTTKIWDLTRKTCVHTMRAFMAPVLSVFSLQDLPYLILASKDGIVHMWNSQNSRLERMVSFGCSPHEMRLCMMGTRRLVITRGDSISFMDISNEEAGQ